MHQRFSTIIFLGACCLLLVLLWLPGVRYPVVSDTVVYAQLGRSVWQHGTYMLNGLPYALHLPLYAIFSYPFTELLGVRVGMHVAGLFSGFAVLIATFFLVHQIRTAAKYGRSEGNIHLVIPAAVTLAVLIHPAFVLMTMLGSADLLFAALFLSSLMFFLRANDDQRWYIAAGIAAGLACLTRYNGVPLFLLFGGFTLWKRRDHLRARWFWMGMMLGAAIFGTWLLRNWLVFGNPLHTDYGALLNQEAPDHLSMFLKNVVYYGNPVHNIFPFFFVFALVGLWGHARREPLLVCAMIAAWMISAVWYVQAIRFFFPGFVILLYFSVLGIRDVVWRARFLVPVILLVGFLGLAVQSLSLCLYTYGQCNAWVDRTVGIFPKDMHLSSEGFYAWDLARQYVNAHVQSDATMLLDPLGAEGLFRPDLRVTLGPAFCPMFKITQTVEIPDEIHYKTTDLPVTYVVLKRCP